MKIDRYFFSILFIISCGGQSKSLFKEADQDMFKIQLMKKTEQEGVYQCRLHIKPAYREEIKAQVHKLQYQQDSSFYLALQGLRYYPEAVEFISSGSDNQMEYLIYFDEKISGAEAFMYEDKHVSKKVYRLELKP